MGDDEKKTKLLVSLMSDWVEGSEEEFENLEDIPGMTPERLEGFERLMGEMRRLQRLHARPWLSEAVDRRQNEWSSMSARIAEMGREGLEALLREQKPGRLAALYRGKDGSEIAPTEEELRTLVLDLGIDPEHKDD
jgi:hypothetical protein